MTRKIVLPTYQIFTNASMSSSLVSPAINIQFLDNIGLELDIFLPKYKLAIEFNGLYWHSTSVNKNPKYHMLKRIYCHKEKIELIQIFENEWINTPEIIKSIIKSKLFKSKNKIYARKLKIGFPNKKESSCFLRENHIKGESIGSSFVGLYDKNKLLFLIGYKMNGTELYLSRVCTQINLIVVGGLSKLLHFLIKENQPKTIKSYTDHRYFNGNSLASLGFTRKSTFLSWMWTNYKETFNRQFCMATKLLTEKEHAKELGLVKIYDAGQSLWIKELN